MDFTVLIIIVVLNSALSGLVSYAAKQRKRSAAGFFWLSFLVSFLVAILILLALPAGKSQVDNLDRLPCPHYDEKISKNAKICPHCRQSVGSHFENIEAQREADEADKKLAIQRLEVAASKKAKVEAAARKEFVLKWLRKPIVWIAIGIMIAILALAVFIYVINEDRKTRLLSPDCTVKNQSIDISFDIVMKIGFSLPDECGKSLGLAVREGLVDSRLAVGKVNVVVYFDDREIETFSVAQGFTKSAYTVQVPNELFWEYSSDYSRIAESVKVELTYQSSLTLTQPASATQIIPKISPVVQLEKMMRTSTSTEGFSTFAVFLEYATYQVADSIEFDWPGIDWDQTQKTPGRDVARYNGFITSIFGTRTSKSANVVISVIHDNDVVQTLIADAS